MSEERSYRYRVVDVFTRVALEGNALAVFPESGGLDDATMQRIAREFNLSETVFIEPAQRADCAIRFRIFTPQREMVFAGHPTVGGCFVAMSEGLIARECDAFAVEEKIGPVAITVETGEAPLIWLTTPPLAFEKEYERSSCAEALGLVEGDLLDVTPQIVNAGNPGLFVALRTRDAVDRAWLDAEVLRRIRQDDSGFCVFVFAPTTEGAYSRMFAPDYGIVEDPATGSATGPLGAFMRRHGLLPTGAGKQRFVSEQGTKMGRRSLLYFEFRGADILVGGYVTPVMEGVLRL